jgi:hypothetical protein
MMTVLPNALKYYTIGRRGEGWGVFPLFDHPLNIPVRLSVPCNSPLSRPPTTRTIEPVLFGSW